MAGVSLFGDWEKAKKLTGSLPAKWKVARERATLQEAHFLRAKIVEGLRDQAPGGEAFKPLSPITIAMRQAQGFKGRKALVRRGDLRNGITVTRIGGKIFVGVLRTAKSKTGKDLINIAELNENGSRTIVIPITPASSRFYHMALRKAGIAPPTGAHHGGGTPIAVMRIPARPFISPVFRKFGKPEDVRRRFYLSVAQTMGPSYLLPGVK